VRPDHRGMRYYDAMTTNRPYRNALEKSIALAEIKNCSGVQFDPEMAAVFCDLMSGAE